MGSSPSRSLGNGSDNSGKLRAKDAKIKELKAKNKEQRKEIDYLKKEIKNLKKDHFKFRSFPSPSEKSFSPPSTPPIHPREKSFTRSRPFIHPRSKSLTRSRLFIHPREKSLVSLMTQSSTGSDLDDYITLPNATSDAPQLQGNLPKIGDHVVSMWGASKWQYFTATIVNFDSNTLKYTIEWDDGDPTGRVVDYYNLAKDEVPSEDQIGVGSKVLFHQGAYRPAEVHGVTRSGGLRWHQGEITRIYKAEDGTKRYGGKHTKGENDGKWITYKDYSEKFLDYKLEDFRMPPNVFDILDSVEKPRKERRRKSSDSEEDAIDVFISYAVVNSPSAVRNNEVTSAELPPSYEQVMIEDLCDPRDIVKHLREMGVKVYFTEREDDSSLLEIAQTLKRAKVFIACLSDEYASNDRCRMEFQHAKKTLKIPVIPLVVGTGSFQWKMTVVGMLIAGELYIHFKDRTVEGFKMNELVRSIKRHIPDLQLKNMQFAATGDASLDLITTPGLTLTGARLETTKPDVFFSYCWSNSYSAQKNNQISGIVGTEWNDPRLIADKLSKVTNSVTWIDIKRLESAADGMGMFEQIATAISDSQIVVACVSNEYADSDNCRMELQFAASSLQKPMIILVVGKGSHWEQTVVGKVSLLGKATINMQDVTEEKELEEKIKLIKKEIDGFTIARPAENKLFKARAEKKASRAPTVTGQAKFKAPRLGDHVVCLHQNWAYFMATVEEFDPTDLVYTVDWDDGDPTGRVQSYSDVALDVVPEPSQVGIGSVVLFPQGSYSGTEGTNTGGQRYHQGKVTGIREDENGSTVYDGEHTKSEADGKWITWPGYNPQFIGYTLDALRVSPNAMDALYACKQAFNL